MYEVEVKVETAHEPVRERLAELGAEPLGAARQRDTYYDHPVRDFAETDEALRLREEEPLEEWRAGTAEPEVTESGSTSTLTYKGPLVDDASKTREEVETRVDDPEALEAVLRGVGFEPAAEVAKERARFAHDGYVVALDSVAGLGEFVEVEAEADVEAGIDEVRSGAFDLCRQLGLDPNDSTRTSYLAMVLEAA